MKPVVTILFCDMFQLKRQIFLLPVGRNCYNKAVGMIKDTATDGAMLTVLISEGHSNDL